MKKKIKNLSSENLFDFTEYLEMQKDEIEIDFGFFRELAEENKIIYNQVAANSLIEDMEELKNGFFTNCYLGQGDEGEIETK